MSIGVYQLLRIGVLENVWLELDSICVYHFISHGVVDTHATALLVDVVRIMISEGDWNVEVSLVFLEANFCANKLAKHDHPLCISVVIFGALL